MYVRTYIDSNYVHSNSGIALLWLLAVVSIPQIWLARAPVLVPIELRLDDPLL